MRVELNKQANKQKGDGDQQTGRERLSLKRRPTLMTHLLSLRASTSQRMGPRMASYWGPAERLRWGDHSGPVKLGWGSSGAQGCPAVGVYITGSGELLGHGDALCTVPAAPHTWLASVISDGGDTEC